MEQSPFDYRRKKGPVPDELIDVYDENMVPLGVASRSVAHEVGLWHKAIHCWFYRRTGPETFLQFQKRGSRKLSFPRLFDITAAGHYKAGESIENGVREIHEELGVKFALEELISLGIKIDLGKSPTFLIREFCNVYLGEATLEPTKYSLDASEVEGLIEISLSDGLELFSGRSSTAEARGVEWDPISQVWRPITLTVEINQFVPRIDPYYLKIFSIVSRHITGGGDLSI